MSGVCAATIVGCTAATLSMMYDGAATCTTCVRVYKSSVQPTQRQAIVARERKFGPHCVTQGRGRAARARACTCAASKATPSRPLGSAKRGKLDTLGWPKSRPGVGVESKAATSARLAAAWTNDLGVPLPTCAAAAVRMDPTTALRVGSPCACGVIPLPEETAASAPSEAPWEAAAAAVAMAPCTPCTPAGGEEAPCPLAALKYGLPPTPPVADAEAAEVPVEAAETKRAAASLR